MYTKAQLYKQLEDMNAPTDRIVLVHSSLKAIGETEGRGEGFLEVLINYFTSNNGLLCIPTHTWANVSEECKITLDLMNPSTCIGTLPNIAAKHPEAMRSMHPTHSMAVFGKKESAMAFIDGEDTLVTPAHPSGCYGKIFDNGGYILLIGVEHNRNTYLHCVEEMLGIKNRIAKLPKTATIRHSDGSITKKVIYPHEAVGIGDVSLRYTKYEPAFRHHGAIIDGYIECKSSALRHRKNERNNGVNIYKKRRNRVVFRL